jgi:oxygen-independent coproporphyrinogen III oxidase
VTPVITEELLRRFDVAGPRYTSYPTADRFAPSFGEPDLLAALRGIADSTAPMSLYVHIPFCESVCYYCACNKIVTRQHGRAAEYLDALESEVELVVGQLGRGHAVSQLHFGGGTPTFLSDDELTRLMAALRRWFSFEPDAEMSIEVDPRTVDAGRLRHLKAIGINRLSLGVQDFDPDVQRAVHREQSFESVRALMTSAREIGFDSINLDLIYGLPLQSVESFARTIAQVGELRPDRIAAYGYAHLPQRFKPQRRIDASELPRAEVKLKMQALGLATLRELGYCEIGMDHFALPGDALAVALREGRLHRNFQGYSTQSDRDLVALGVSAISRIGNTYSQNAKALPEYYAALRAGRLPVERGLALSAEDRLRRDVIMALMCRGRVEFARIAELHGVDLREHCAEAMRNLARLVDDGLVQLEPGAVQVTPLGWAFVRGVAMLFDEHLQASRKAQQARAAGHAAGGASPRVPVAEAAEEQVVQFSRIL